MDYNYTNYNVTQNYTRKTNVFGIITSILLAIMPFVPMFYVEGSELSRGFHKLADATHFGIFTFGYSLSKIGDEFGGREEDAQLFFAIFAVIGGVILFNALLGLIFSLTKVKVANIIFAVLNLIWVSLSTAFCAYFCYASQEDGDGIYTYITLYLMVVVAIVHLVQACIYKTKGKNY